ncbi:uncharacterized protein [Typha latifolia]|uniref:uncharacterized protein n=1 Tax=Typha latifolia TaxID=4733 RepID=UPI003C2D6A52
MANRSSSAAPPPPPPPPLPPSAAKKGFLRRILPFLLTANLAVGVYVFARAYKKKPDEKDDEAIPVVTSAPILTTVDTVPEKRSAEPVPAPIKVLPPIPEEEQRQLFKWILEEKRKLKPRDSAEKKKINEEKALLKEFIRAKSVPSL